MPAPSRRSFSDIENTLTSVRLVLEPISDRPPGAQPQPPQNFSNPSSQAGRSNEPKEFGVRLYEHPSTEPRSSVPTWYRVLGRVDEINRDSTTFIFAALPILHEFPVEDLTNTGYLDFPSDDEKKIDYIDINWGSDLLGQITIPQIRLLKIEITPETEWVEGKLVVHVVVKARIANSATIPVGEVTLNANMGEFTFQVNVRIARLTVYVQWVGTGIYYKATGEVFWLGRWKRVSDEDTVPVFVQQERILPDGEQRLLPTG